TPSLLHLFLFNARLPPATSPLSLHDALPICRRHGRVAGRWPAIRRFGYALIGTAVLAAILALALTLFGVSGANVVAGTAGFEVRSEEHTSELQSRGHLVCRLLLEKKKD